MGKIIKSRVVPKPKEEVILKPVPTTSKEAENGEKKDESKPNQDYPKAEAPKSVLANVFKTFNFGAIKKLEEIAPKPNEDVLKSFKFSIKPLEKSPLEQTATSKPQKVQENPAASENEIETDSPQIIENSNKGLFSSFKFGSDVPSTSQAISPGAISEKSRKSVSFADKVTINEYGLPMVKLFQRFSDKNEVALDLENENFEVSREVSKNDEPSIEQHMILGYAEDLSKDKDASENDNDLTQALHMPYSQDEPGPYFMISGLDMFNMVQDKKSGELKLIPTETIEDESEDEANKRKDSDDTSSSYDSDDSDSDFDHNEVFDYGPSGSESEKSDQEREEVKMDDLVEVDAHMDEDLEALKEEVLKTTKMKKIEKPTTSTSASKTPEKVEKQKRPRIVWGDEESEKDRSPSLEFYENRRKELLKELQMNMNDIDSKLKDSNKTEQEAEDECDKLRQKLLKKMDKELTKLGTKKKDKDEILGEKFAKLLGGFLEKTDEKLTSKDPKISSKESRENRSKEKSKKEKDFKKDSKKDRHKEAKDKKKDREKDRNKSDKERPLPSGPLVYKKGKLVVPEKANEKSDKKHKLDDKAKDKDRSKKKEKDKDKERPKGDSKKDSKKESSRRHRSEHKSEKTDRKRKKSPEDTKHPAKLPKLDPVVKEKVKKQDFTKGEQLSSVPSSSSISNPAETAPPSIYNTKLRSKASDFFDADDDSNTEKGPGLNKPVASAMIRNALFEVKEGEKSSEPPSYTSILYKPGLLAEAMSKAKQLIEEMPMISAFPEEYKKKYYKKRKDLMEELEKKMKKYIQKQREKFENWKKEEEERPKNPEISISTALPTATIPTETVPSTSDPISQIQVKEEPLDIDENEPTYLPPAMPAVPVLSTEETRKDGPMEAVDAQVAPIEATIAQKSSEPAHKDVQETAATNLVEQRPESEPMTTDATEKELTLEVGEIKEEPLSETSPTSEKSKKKDKKSKDKSKDGSKEKSNDSKDKKSSKDSKKSSKESKKSKKDKVKSEGAKGKDEEPKVKKEPKEKEPEKIPTSEEELQEMITQHREKLNKKVEKSLSDYETKLKKKWEKEMKEGKKHKKDIKREVDERDSRSRRGVFDRRIKEERRDDVYARKSGYYRSRSRSTESYRARRREHEDRLRDAFFSRGRTYNEIHGYGRRGYGRSRSRSGSRERGRSEWCKVCRLRYYSKERYEEHCDSERHKEEDEKLTKSMQNKAVYKCEACNVTCQGITSIKMHLDGQNHRKTIMILRRMRRPIPMKPKIVALCVTDIVNYKMGRPLPADAEAKRVDTIDEETENRLLSGLNLPNFGAYPGAVKTEGEGAQPGQAAAGTGGEEEQPNESLPPSFLAFDPDNPNMIPVNEIRSYVAPADKPHQSKIPVKEEAPEDGEIAEQKVDPKEVAEIIGEEFVETVVDDNNKFLHYKCNLCNCQFADVNAKEVHMKGRRHRLNYKSKIDPTYQVESKQRALYQRQHQPIIPPMFARPPMPQMPPMMPMPPMQRPYYDPQNHPPGHHRRQPMPPWIRPWTGGKINGRRFMTIEQIPHANMAMRRYDQYTPMPPLSSLNPNMMPMGGGYGYGGMHGHYGGGQHDAYGPGQTEPIEDEGEGGGEDGEGDGEYEGQEDNGEEGQTEEVDQSQEEA